MSKTRGKKIFVGCVSKKRKVKEVVGLLQREDHEVEMDVGEKAELLSSYFMSVFSSEPQRGLNMITVALIQKGGGRGSR